MSVLKELSSYDRIVLPNGTRLLIRQEKSPYSSFVARIGYGFAHETPQLDGVSHFAEHMFFESNDRYSTEEIKHQLQWATGSTPDANTYWDRILVGCDMPTENLDTVMQIVAASVNNQQVKADEFEKQRQIVLNEVGYKSPFRDFVESVLFRDLFPDHPYGMRFGGSVESLRALIPDQLDSIRNRYFHGPNLFIVLGGDVSERYVHLAEELFGAHSAEKSPDIPEVPPVQEDKLYVKKLDTTDKQAIHIHQPVTIKPGRDGITLGILSKYLGNDINAPLSRTLREEKRLCYSTGCGLDTGREKIVLFNIGVIGVEESNVDSILRLIEDEVERIKQGDIDSDYLELVKRGEVIFYPRQIETLHERVAWIVSREAYLFPYDHEEYTSVVQSITPEDLTNVAQRYLNGHKVTFVQL